MINHINVPEETDIDILEFLNFSAKKYNSNASNHIKKPSFADPGIH